MLRPHTIRNTHVSHDRSASLYTIWIQYCASCINPPVNQTNADKQWVHHTQKKRTSITTLNTTGFIYLLEITSSCDGASTIGQVKNIETKLIRRTFAVIDRSIGRAVSNHHATTSIYSFTLHVRRSTKWGKLIEYKFFQIQKHINIVFFVLQIWLNEMWDSVMIWFSCLWLIYLIGFDMAWWEQCQHNLLVNYVREKTTTIGTHQAIGGK